MLAPLLDAATAQGRTVVVVSEYGITDISRPVDVNRMLRAKGLLRVHTQDGMEYLDPWTSRAFAVADHQVARSHGLLPAGPADAPVLLCSDPSAARRRFEATDVKDLLLRLALE